MNTEQEKILIQAFENTSFTTQQFLAGDKYTEVIKDLGIKFNLSKDESRNIQVKTLYFLLGISTKEEVIKDLLITLNSREEKEIVDILTNIDEQILVNKYDPPQNDSLNWQKQLKNPE